MKMRTFQDRLYGAYSNTKTATAWVFQDSIIPPLLYNLFVSDLSSTSAQAMIAQYADDTAIILSSSYEYKQVGSSSSQ